jgi:hypothetical protein
MKIQAPAQGSTGNQAIIWAKSSRGVGAHQHEMM